MKDCLLVILIVIALLLLIVIGYQTRHDICNKHNMIFSLTAGQCVLKSE